MDSVPRPQRQPPLISKTYSSVEVRHPLESSLIEDLPSCQQISSIFNISHGDISRQPAFAFGFDIDGVLMRSTKPIPEAIETLSYLYKNNIPFILLTNGGGKHENTRVMELSMQLGVPITEGNLVQSHTPFKQLVQDPDRPDSWMNKTILVTGGDADTCRHIAMDYGFKRVVTPGDILVAYPSIWPYHQLNVFSDYHHSTSQRLPKPIDLMNSFKTLKIDAIFVFNNPRDWALDSQVILDLLMSRKGLLGIVSEKNGNSSFPNNGWQQDEQPKLFFSNSDLVWARPHITYRDWHKAGIWNAKTDGAVLERIVFGKPRAATFEYAERALNKHRAQMFRGSGHIGGKD
ncbi:putative CDP-alcohol phosphatidyltransferase class-I family protein [Lachnellula subtilissima]|uniref:Putative CDP-alcohol phosphatidyltransferase class-I family protein n=1 Tax=Lachnellula subtilissima TaxID=602034 RepID=A0A8H8RWK9_9HELO|nr:putative CDP-alcohol phosphatidyltransferase class-I family protein [Lachnellula subtilissima]